MEVAEQERHERRSTEQQREDHVHQADGLVIAGSEE